MPSLRIVNYAVNGAGVGHLARLVAINRWLRRYALLLGLRPEIYFLTSSEAEGLLLKENFASFKIPSKSVIESAGIDKVTYLSLAKQWIWHSLGLLRPDLLIVDTFPRGSFGELLSALDLARSRAFIYRPVKNEFGERPEFQSMLALYDCLLVPEKASDAQVVVPSSCQDRLHYFGPVISRERFELLDRQQAHQRLAIQQGRRVIYLSAGGGGDVGADTQLPELIERLAQLPQVHLIVAAGPLYRSQPIYRPHLTWLQGWGSQEYLKAADLALSAAGYNSCGELWQAGIPTLFLPQEKVADDQYARARRAVAAGAADFFDGSLEQVEEWLGPERGAQASQCALSLAPRNYARDVAAELLRLVLPPQQVDAAQEAFDDALASALPQVADVQRLSELMQAFQGRGRELNGSQLGKLARHCREIHQSGWGGEQLSRIAHIWSHKLDRWAPWERARSLHDVLAETASWNNWNAVATVLRMLVNERELKPAELSLQLIQALQRWRAGGQDLYAMVARLSEQQSRAHTNRTLLEAL